MAEIKDRIIEYLKISGLTKQNFCKETGISYANMVGKSLKSELGGEQISSIFMKFPNINPDWLLLGKGKMLRETSPDSPSNTTLDRLLERIEYLARENGQLQAENEELKNKLARAENKMAASAKAAAG